MPPFGIEMGPGIEAAIKLEKNDFQVDLVFKNKKIGIQTQFTKKKN